MKRILVSALLLGLMSAKVALAAALDLKSGSGSVLIAAPTALNGPTNEGVWFVNPQTKAFSLDLPALAGNQVYEGWILDNCTGQALSIGEFRAPGGIDSDAAGIYAGPKNLDYPAVPGSDFVTLGQDITDGAHDVLVTVESYPISSALPSKDIILRVSIPQGATVGTNLTLVNVAQ